MNAKRSNPQPDRLRRGTGGNVRKTDSLAAAGMLPHVRRASLVFALLTGPGMLPGVYAQVSTLGTAAATKKTPILAPYIMPKATASKTPMRNLGATPMDVTRLRAAGSIAPFAKVDPRAYLNALIQRQRMPAVAVTNSSASVAASNTTFGVPVSDSAQGKIALAATTARINISNSSNKWFPFGPYRRPPAAAADQGSLPVAGRVNAIDYAKDKSGIFYLATASGGVWKWDPSNTDGLNSLNGTLDANWTHFSDTQFPTPETSCVAVDPSDHRIVYVGLGDYDGSANLGSNAQVQSEGKSYGVGYGLGIMKSVNGGATWYNIGNGNPLTTAPGLTGSTNTANAIMEGTAVSAIVINPTNTKNVIATSGRGVNPGAIWYSTDSGNTWTKAKLASGGDITGSWSSLSASNLDNTAANLKYYASRQNDGVYSSSDGITWTKLPVPLVFNGTGNGGAIVNIRVVASKLQRAGNLLTGQRVVYVADASETKRDGRIFKSVDGGNTWTDITGEYPNYGNSAFALASFSLNLNSDLVPITGNSSSGSVLRTLLVDLLSAGTIEFATSTSPLEPTGASGPKYLGTPTGKAVSQVSDPGAGPDFVYPDDFYYPDPITFPNVNVPNKVTHDFKISPASLSSYLAGTSTTVGALLATDGGVYPSVINNGIYQLDASLGYLFYQSPDVAIAFPDTTSQSTLNDTLVVSQMINGDFLENGDNISVRSSTIDNTIATTDTALTPPSGAPATYAYEPTWLSIASLVNIGNPNYADPIYALVTYAANTGTVSGDDQAGHNYTQSINPNGISDGTEPDIDVSSYPTMDTISFDPSDPTGATQVMLTSSPNVGPGARYNDPVPAKKIYYTNSNWSSTNPQPTSGNPLGSLDITPDQQQNIGHNGATIYLYNQTDPQDGTTGPNWRAGYHTQLGMPVAWDVVPDVKMSFSTATFDPLSLPMYSPAVNFVRNEVISIVRDFTSDPALYVGDGAYLWRFDPPGSKAYTTQPGPVLPQPTANTGPAFVAPSHTVYYPFNVGPNVDRGIWRQVGQALAGNTPDDHISAIGTIPGSGVVYVGTSNGTLWVAPNAYYAPYPITNTTLPPLNETWYKIAGPGTSATLPNRPITSINVNVDPNATIQTYNDILVTLGGAPGADTSTGTARVGRVYRAANATGVLNTGNVPAFVNVSGTIGTTSFAYLPDVTVYDIARDPDDPTNTFYAATDVGVFSTIDAGSTWSNATAPLGLPNVAATKIKVLQNGNTDAKTLAVTTLGRGAWGFDLTNIAPTIRKPNLIFSTTFNRSGNVEIVNLKVTNVSTTTAPAGTAFNVILNSASLVGQTGTSLGSAFTNLNNPTTTAVSATNAIPIGNIGQNQTVYVTLYFNAATIRAGTLAKLSLGGLFTLPPIPPGTTTTFTNAGALTHLP